MDENVVPKEEKPPKEEPKEVKLEPILIKPTRRKPKPRVLPEVLMHMESEANNEYEVLLDSPQNPDNLLREEWVARRVAEKIKQYHTDPAIKDAFDNWDCHHGG